MGLESVNGDRDIRRCFPASRLSSRESCEMVMQNDLIRSFA